MAYIDAHVHVWTPDTSHYPLAKGYKKEDMKPRSFTPEELFKHCKPAGVDRINLIQMSFYGFDNRYMLDMIKLHEGVFAGTAVIDPTGDDPGKLMGELAKQSVRAFRIYPGLGLGGQPNAVTGKNWLKPAGYEKMFAAGAKNNQAMSCLINTDALPDLDRMCQKFPETPVIIDHLCRIGVSGTVDDKEVDALCDMAKHKRVMVKIGAFYALGKKKAPYTDLRPLIQKVVKAFGPKRCMWETDCPFQVQEGHKYQDSIDLIRKRLDFLTDDDKDWLLRKTAEEFFFKAS
ncbi:MAG TPA: amidohydrolase family protein [Gemmataceae bacterium]|nr:amidohydrolase family protein [Gemmataceae bacterium]